MEATRQAGDTLGGAYEVVATGVPAGLGSYAHWDRRLDGRLAQAVLSIPAQKAVEVYGWLAPGEMVRGLALAETTPGPLIMVVQFVGFLAAFRDPGGLDPYLAAVLASLLVTWVTFTPSFLWIFLGAPYIERLRHNPALGGALAAITAAVVGVVLMATGRAGRKSAIPFGPFMLVGALLAVLWGPWMVDAYSSFVSAS